MEKQCSICGELTTNKKLVTKESFDTEYKTIVSIEALRYRAYEENGETKYSIVPERLELCDTCLNNLINE